MTIPLFSLYEKKSYKTNSSIYKKKESSKKDFSNKNIDANSVLMHDLNDAKKEIETLLLHLDYQTDPDMIDCYTYQLKGAYMRYKFILRQIQQVTH